MHESTEKKQVGDKDRTQITQITQFFVLYKATDRRPERSCVTCVICVLFRIPYDLRSIRQLGQQVFVECPDVLPVIERSDVGLHRNTHFFLVQHELHDNIVCTAFLTEENNLHIGSHRHHFEVTPCLIEFGRIGLFIIAVL